MESVQLLVEHLLEILQGLPIDATGPPLPLTRSQAILQVLPLVDLVHQEWTFLSPVGLSQSASLLGRSRTGFSLMELILHDRPYSSGIPVSFRPPLPAAFPSPLRLPIARSRGFHPASGTIRPSDYSPGVAPHFAFAYRVAYPGATRRPGESSWGHVLIFRTVPSANTLVRWVNENAFASIVQARPCPTFGRPVHHRGGPHRLRPGTSPHAFRIPPRGGHPALRRIAPPADDALPPSLDMTPLIRAPEGLQPSRTTRCSAHTTPWADFYDMVRMNRFILSHDSVTCRRSPEVSSTAFDTQPPDLPPVSLMDMGFAVPCPLARHRRPPIRFLFIGSCLCSALLSGPASRRVLFHPCASL